MAKCVSVLPPSLKCPWKHTTNKAGLMPFLARKTLFIAEVNLLSTARTCWCSTKLTKHSVKILKLHFVTCQEHIAIHCTHHVQDNFKVCKKSFWDNHIIIAIYKQCTLPYTRMAKLMPMWLLGNGYFVIHFLFHRQQIKVCSCHQSLYMDIVYGYFHHQTAPLYVTYKQPSHRQKFLKSNAKNVLLKSPAVVDPSCISPKPISKLLKTTVGW